MELFFNARAGLLVEFKLWYSVLRELSCAVVLLRWLSVLFAELSLKGALLLGLRHN